MRVFVFFILCIQLCGCSATRSFIFSTGGDSQEEKRLEQAVIVSSDADGGDEQVDEPEQNPEEKTEDSVVIKAVKTIGVVVLGAVLVGVSIATKIPIGAL